MQYILITATGKRGIADASALNDQVNTKLSEGFELFGSPGVTINPQGTALYYQAMLKK